MKREDILFFVGLVSLICSLFLFPFVAYLFPAVWLGWEYNLPDFVVNMTLWLEALFRIDYQLAFLWFFRFVFLGAVFFGVIAYCIAHHISRLEADATEEASEAPREEAAEASMRQSLIARENSKESVLFFLKLVVILALVFIVADVIQWAISLSLGNT